MSDRPLLCGFLKVRNEVIREGDLYRVLHQLKNVCDVIVACDDASTDGTREVLLDNLPPENVLLVPPELQEFRQELRWKQLMLQRVRELDPQWVLWMDGDEVLDRRGESQMRAFAHAMLERPEVAWRLHYSQLWRNTSWARTDDGFDDGWFVKLWKWRPDLSFEVVDRTHHHQFPSQLLEGPIGKAPFEVIHYGNFGKNITWKVIQYWGGLGGVDRHLVFGHASYRPVDPAILPECAEHWPGELPTPFTEREVTLIRSMENLKLRPETFAVVIPTYNRVKDLPQALESLLGQTYERWVALVVDDGSQDGTYELMRPWQDLDPRIFYVRFPVNRGAVAVNEHGMEMAVEMAEWWTRLGSDDWWEPSKLERDAVALRQHPAVYGPFQVVRDGQKAEVCNPPRRWEENKAALLGQTGFVCSWANAAVRTTVLRQVKARWGAYADPRLRNMEDFLINARIARLVPWRWRGVIDGRLVVDPSPEETASIAARLSQVEADAFWRCVTSGASGNWDQTVQEDALSRQLIAAENQA